MQWSAISRLAVALSAAIWPWLAGSATARPEHTPHALAVAYSPAITDGRRYVVYEPSQTSLVIRDEAMGRSRTVSITAGCEPLWGAYGTFLVVCHQPPPPTTAPYLLLQASTGALTPVPGAGTGWNPNQTGFGKIGRYWISGLTGIRDPSEFYVNWRTGMPNSFPSPPPDSIESVPRDLDTPELRRLGPPQEDPEAAGAEGKIVVREDGRTTRSDYPDLVAFRHERRWTRLDRCRRACLVLSLAGLRVTWAHRDGRLGFGYDLQRRKRLVWRLPRSITSTGPQGVQGFSGIQHTRRRVYFTTGIAGESRPPYRYRIYAARWPGSR